MVTSWYLQVTSGVTLKVTSGVTSVSIPRSPFQLTFASVSGKVDSNNFKFFDNLKVFSKVSSEVNSKVNSKANSKVNSEVNPKANVKVNSEVNSKQVQK